MCIACQQWESLQSVCIGVNGIYSKCVLPEVVKTVTVYVVLPSFDYHRYEWNQIASTKLIHYANIIIIIER